MGKKIQYVSNKLVRKQYNAFENKRLPQLEASIAGKYEAYFSKKTLHRIVVCVCSSLSVSIYLNGAWYSEFPSYRHQLLMINDFRNLLNSFTSVSTYFYATSYYHCYDEVHCILNERVYYNKMHELSNEFLEIIKSNSNDFPYEYAEKYFDYIEEIVPLVIREMTDMILEQIFSFFPSEGPAFYNSICSAEQKNSSSIEDMPAEESQDVENDDANQDQNVRKVRFI